MAYKKRESAAFVAASKRSDGLRAIDPTGALDLGNGNTHAAYLTAIKELADAVGEHNEALAVADKKANQVKAKEKQLRRWSSRMLTAVGLKYGLDSNEYEQAGGTRESERKLGRKMVPATATGKTRQA